MMRKLRRVARIIRDGIAIIRAGVLLVSALGSITLFVAPPISTDTSHGNPAQEIHQD
jgi:hypothetical protein